MLASALVTWALPAPVTLYVSIISTAAPPAIPRRDAPQGCTELRVRQRRAEKLFGDWNRVDIGFRRQLFVDDRMVLSSCNVERTLGKGTKVYLGGGNGLLRADREWELGIGNIVSVIRHAHLFRMWYRPFQVL